MSKKKLAGIIIACTIVIIMVIVLVNLHYRNQQQQQPPRYSFSVSRSPSEAAGSVSFFPSGGEYESGTQVTLTATPASGYTFDHWSGNASGTEPTITVTMDSDKNIVANFVGNVNNPPVQVTLDYFGIKNTHQPSVSFAPNTIQLYVVVDDGKTAWNYTYPYNGEGIPMECFQLESLGQQRIFETSSIGDHLTISVLAYSCADKETTLIVGRALQAFEPSLGPLLDFYESLPQSKELIGWYEHTWGASEDWGAKQGRYKEEGSGDLRLWFRIWSNTEPTPISKPLLIPAIEIQNVKLPTGVRVRQPSETPFYNTWTFEFTIANHESFTLPIYWRLETSPHSPETSVGSIIYKTDDTVNVLGDGKWTVTTQYWFKISGNYTWKYIIECPRGNLVTSWNGTLSVEP